MRTVADKKTNNKISNHKNCHLKGICHLETGKYKTKHSALKFKSLINTSSRCNLKIVLFSRSPISCKKVLRV